jgi:murein DD-endopeptidase MepM/ murein hydrolase activator NlpD
MKKPIIDGYIVSGFGFRMIKWFGKMINQFHPGLDISTKNSNPLVFAAYSGIIYQLGYSTSFGNRIWIKNDVGYYAVYAHLKEINSNLVPGSKIKEGDYLGIMGNTGMSFGRHLHFELREAPYAGAKSIHPIEIENLYKS